MIFWAHVPVYSREATPWQMVPLLLIKHAANEITQVLWVCILFASELHVASE